MTHQKNFRIRIKLLFCFVAAVMLLVPGGPPVATTAIRQDGDDETRRLWNKQFMKAREGDSKPRPNARTQTAKTKQQAGAKSVVKTTRPATVKSTAKHGAVGDETVDGELIGVTIWRLRPALPGEDRVLVQKEGAYALERITADTPFKEGQFLRISVEAPREFDNYLYVVDREVFKDSRGERLGEPNLIFPARTTPPGGNVISAGRSVYVPAQGDPKPYFALQRSGENHVGEMLFILISPEPLPVNVERQPLDPATVAQWKRQCGGQTERRELSGGVGKPWTKEEQEADEGKRKLVQSDPLPQTIYRVRAKRGGCALAAIPLQIAP